MNNISITTAPKKFTYILGAGASAQALPLVKDNPSKFINGLPTGFKLFIEQLNALATSISSDLEEEVSELKRDLTHFSIKAVEFNTIDTYAKFLHLQGHKHNDELKRLKDTLSIYFLYEQIINKKFDKRYLIFLISILERSIFPENLNILTWNYDFQMQIAAEYFQKETFKQTGFSTEHSPPLINYFPGVWNIPIPGQKHQLIHLNGIAGFSAHKGNRNISGLPLIGQSLTPKGLLTAFFKEKAHYDRLLTFAWENAIQTFPGNYSTMLKHALSAVQNTEVLIVIGYSFPFFNREIDRLIFEEMKKSNSLKQIYFQDPSERSGKFLINQFELKDVDIFDVKDIEQFFIPSEF